MRREFDYLVPDELRELVAEGTRVKVPFGQRKVLGVVTAVISGFAMGSPAPPKLSPLSLPDGSRKLRRDGRPPDL